MSVLAHIGRGLPKKLITAIVPAGEGQALVTRFGEAPGMLSISSHHARGVGSRRVRSGQLYFDEKDVLIALVEAESADTLFAELFAAGRIAEPGVGLMFMEPVLRGHPMLPLGNSDW